MSAVPHDRWRSRRGSGRQRGGTSACGDRTERAARFWTGTGRTEPADAGRCGGGLFAVPRHRVFRDWQPERRRDGWARRVAPNGTWLRGVSPRRHSSRRDSCGLSRRSLITEVFFVARDGGGGGGRLQLPGVLVPW